jgi:hypothetical protein
VDHVKPGPDGAFLTLQMVMLHIIESSGHNDFKLGHLRKDSLIRADMLPVSLPCDLQTLVNAHFDIARLSALQASHLLPSALHSAVTPLTAMLPVPVIYETEISELDPFLF